jgi:hypothetical protein
MSGYREIRYESLREDAGRELSDLLSWLQLDAQPGFCEDAVEACRLERLREKDAGDLPIPGTRIPSGFFRRGSAGGWKDDLTTTEVRIVDHLCGDLMEALGYPRTHGSAGVGRIRILAHDAVVRLRESLDWQLQRLARLI